MASEVLVEALIYHGPGGCPICSGPLVVADSEISLMELDQDGNVIHDEVEVRCEGACLHCGIRIPMMRWNGGYCQYTPTSRLLKQLQRYDEIHDRVLELNSSGKENPFI